MQIESEIPNRVLAIYAHPNDADLACGGTLAKWVKGGAEIDLFVVTSGDKGNDVGVSGDLSTHRRREVKEAARQLGLNRVEFLGSPDGEFENDLSLRSALVTQIRHTKPDVVITHDPTALLFGDVYVNHRDHRVVGSAVLDVVQAAAPNRRYFSSDMHAHTVNEVWLSATEQANVAVDISESLQTKISAMKEHHSQLTDPENVDDVVKSRAQSDARAANLKFAEVFRRLFLT